MRQSHNNLKIILINNHFFKFKYYSVKIKLYTKRTVTFSKNLVKYTEKDCKNNFIRLSK